MATEMEVHVACYAGYRGEERPQRFTLGSRVIEVAEILDQWHGSDYRYFKLRGEDDSVYILRHEEAADKWELTMFDAGGRNETRLSST